MPKTSMRKPSFLLVISLVLLVLILWNFRAVIIYGQYDIEVVSHGQVKHEKMVKVIFANTETILTSPIEGKVILPNEEGRRYANREIIATVIPTGIDHGDSGEEVTLKAPNSGLFYTRYDNLEGIITPENLMNMDLEGLLSQIPVIVTPIEQDVPVRKHSPIGKIVNNLYPTWMFVYLDDSDKMIIGDTVKIIVDNNEYSGVVMKVVQQPKGAIVRFSQYIRASTETRFREVSWIVKPPTRGIVVPSSAVTIRGEEKGVYLAEEGLSRFRSVKVIDDNGSFVCIQGVREGAKVITNPKKAL